MTSKRKTAGHLATGHRGGSTHPHRDGASRRAAHAPGSRWSAAVTRGSDALDLERGVFTLQDPKAIARSLKRSAERSHRRKASPFASAMSMLTFYVNRAGSNLEPDTRRRLEQAKQELRRLYGRPPRPA